MLSDGIEFLNIMYKNEKDEQYLELTSNIKHFVLQTNQFLNNKNKSYLHATYLPK